MKYILLFLLILNIKSTWTTFTGLFISKKRKVDKFEKNWKEYELEYGEENTKIYVPIISLFVAIYHSLFYIVSMNFIGTLAFSILSIFFLLRTWRNFVILTKYIMDKDISKQEYNRLISIIWLGYMWYLIFNLVIKF